MNTFEKALLSLGFDQMLDSETGKVREDEKRNQAAYDMQECFEELRQLDVAVFDYDPPRAQMKWPGVEVGFDLSEMYIRHGVTDPNFTEYLLPAVFLELYYEEHPNGEKLLAAHLAMVVDEPGKPLGIDYFMLTLGRIDLSKGQDLEEMRTFWKQFPADKKHRVRVDADGNMVEVK